MSRKLSTKWLFIYSFYDCIVVQYILCQKKIRSRWQNDQHPVLLTTKNDTCQI